MQNLVNILYLEIEASPKQSLKHSLPHQKYFFESSKNKTDYLDRLAEKSFDILIIDYHSLKENQLDFLKYLFEQDKNYSILITLFSKEAHIITDLINIGCKGFIFKDIDSYINLLLLNIENIFKNIQLTKKHKKVKKHLILCKNVAERVQSIAKIGNWEYLPGKKIARWSVQEFHNFGYQPDSVAPSYDKYIEAIHPDDREIVENRNITCLNTHEKTEFTFRLLLDNNETRYIHAITETDVDHNNNIVRVFGVSQDVTEQKKIEARLKQAATFFQATSQAIIITDKTAVITSTNPAFTRITGYSKRHAIGKNSSFLSSGRHDSKFYLEFWKTIKNEGFWQGELWNKRSNGEIFPCWQSVTVINDSEGNPFQYISIFSDITKRKKSEELIHYQANYDGLTDLPNRHLFLDRMDSAIKQARRGGTKIALMLLDLDRFKWINDTLGHSAGDLILVETAKRLKQSIRSSDTAARLGGDEFTIILPDLNRGINAEIVASKIYAAFSKPVNFEGNEIFISGSIGISIYPEDGKDTETLQKNADTAMYSAKEAGRNRFHYFTPLLQAETERRLTLISFIRKALEKEEFSIYYQPVIDIVNNNIVGAEALIRWQHPTLGFISPVEFIPLAEETGLIRPIGDWVLRRVSQDMRHWQKLGLKPIQISINKSPKQFSSDECSANWKTTLEEYDIPLSRVTVEITESVFIEKGEHSTKSLTNMRKMGIKVALDDFGTGYSSLSYLKRFPVDILKIDREFINEITTNPSDALLVETIITLAEKMKLKVIAEGVETKEQLEFLKKNNCRYIQGYYFSKPLPYEEFKIYLATH